MRPLLAWLVQGMPFSARSRRAIDETLADWEAEERESVAPVDRAIVSLSGALAIARVAAFSVGRETVDFGWCRNLGPRLVVLVAGMFLLAFLVTAPVLDVFGARVLVLSGTLLPAMLFGSAPPAMFLLVAWRPGHQRTPTVGAAVIIGLATLTLGMWIVPAATQFFGTTLVAGLEQPLPSTRPGPAAAPVTGIAALTGVAVLLAAAMARRAPLESPWWFVAVPVLYSVGTSVVHFTIGLPLLLMFRIGDTNPLAVRIATWTATSLTLAAALMLMPRAVRDATPPTD